MVESFSLNYGLKLSVLFYLMQSRIVYAVKCHTFIYFDSLHILSKGIYLFNYLLFIYLCFLFDIVVV